MSNENESKKYTDEERAKLRSVAHIIRTAVLRAKGDENEAGSLLIAAALVYVRSIRAVTPADIATLTEQHFAEMTSEHCEAFVTDVLLALVAEQMVRSAAKDAPR